jgi:hypothetical protein
MALHSAAMAEIPEVEDLYQSRGKIKYSSSYGVEIATAAGV